MSKEIVSVVIPVRNGMPYLAAAIDSALRSESPDYDLEILVVDNFSSDGTSDYLGALNDSRVKVIRPDLPLSIGENWTFACNASRGTYVKLLCADDLIAEGGLQRQFRLLKTHVEAGMVASRRRVIDEDDFEILKAHGLPCRAGFYSGAEILNLCWKNGANVLGEPACILFRRGPLLEALPWSDKWPYLLDMSLYAKVLMKTGAVISHDVDAAFRVHSDSLSSQLANSQAAQFVGFFRDLKSETEDASDASRRYALLRLFLKAYLNQFKRIFFYAYVRFRKRTRSWSA